MEKLKLLFKGLLALSLLSCLFFYVHLYRKKTAITSTDTPQKLPNSTSVQFRQVPAKKLDHQSLADTSETSHKTKNVSAEFVEEQRSRLERVASVCARLNRSRTYAPPREFTKRMMVDDKSGFIFSYIPKVSCKMWKHVFTNILVAHGWKNENLPYLLWQHEDVEREKRLRNYGKVLFVREPLMRLLSAYMSKFRNFRQLQRIWEDVYGMEILKRYRPESETLVAQAASLPRAERPFLNVTFVEFVRYVLERGGELELTEISDHFLPQHLVSHVCEIPYDFIGHYENMATEAPFVLEVFGLTSVAGFPEITPSKSESVIAREFAHVPIKYIKLLQNFYSLDYELFGYDPMDTFTKMLDVGDDDVSN